ncbi:hypothetical protein WJX72_008725 [[Myrmecia] bisecta]|uniref:Mitochondrial carnitine/acylcarnitine carrier-like protein n=1 Tax=[Myrmecia] bisecta TaxID=41462 RepID=A0AAW1PAD0_9CHLO
MAPNAFKDLMAGTVAGSAQLVVGHPFDTIKVKLQSQPQPAPGMKPMYSGALDATRQTIAKEGLQGLFKGMGAPLATVALFNAVLFTVRGQMERLLAHEDGSPLTPTDQAWAGMGAGVAVSFLACPTELIKCRLQAQSGGPQEGKVMYGGPLDVAKHVIRNEGGMLALYKGMAPTLLRELPGNAVMFGCYELVKQSLARSQGLSSVTELGMGSLILAGGIAGVSYWAPVYPADVIKSKLQIDDFRRPAYRGVLDCARKVLAADGFKGLYPGFTPAVARAMPANATCFLVYELAREALGR